MRTEKMLRNGPKTAAAGSTHGSAAPATIIEGIISSFVETGMVNSFTKQLDVKEYDTVEPGEIKANVDEKKNIRGSIPPAFGVDITPIVWLGIFSFFNEILLGQQGLLTMKMKYGI